MKLDLVIVDDSNLWLSLAKKMASFHPLVNSVETFSDSIDAWIYLQKNSPDLVITDIEMPGMNGLSFLEMFGGKLPFISSSTKMEYAAYAEELGCMNFLHKPFSKKGFNHSLEKVYQRLYTKSNIRTQQHVYGKVKA